ncbi:MAG: hypothetical protein R3B65_02180 [Candidatus Paceibacterota bacterium]
MQEAASRFGEKFTEERKISLVDKLINPPPKMPGAERLQVLFDEIDELIYGDRDGGRPRLHLVLLLHHFLLEFG